MQCSEGHTHESSPGSAHWLEEANTNARPHRIYYSKRGAVTGRAPFWLEVMKGSFRKAAVWDYKKQKQGSQVA